jgi:hypothetical protein
MMRVSGWYKRKSQVIVFILAMLLTGITNADTIQIVKTLSADTALRVSVVSQALEFTRLQAEVAARQPAKPAEANAAAATAAGVGSAPTQPQPQPATADNPKDIIKQTFGNLEQLGIPLGWRAKPGNGEWPNKLIGLLLTVFAIFLGAPFWFDILNRLTKVRSAGSVPKTAEAEASVPKQE